MTAFEICYTTIWQEGKASNLYGDGDRGAMWCYNLSLSAAEGCHSRVIEERHNG